MKIQSKNNDTGVCKRCKAEYNASWYERNKAEHLKNVRKNNVVYNAAVKVEINKIKDRPCADCGNKFPPCVMDFDHLDPQLKRFNVGRFGTRSMATVLAEIAKCAVVCANCHRIRTHLRQEMSP